MSDGEDEFLEDIPINEILRPVLDDLNDIEFQYENTEDSQLSQSNSTSSAEAENDLSEKEPTENQEKKSDEEKNNLLNEEVDTGSASINLPNDDQNNKVKMGNYSDPERDKLLAMLEGDEEPEMSVEDMLEKIYDEKKDEEKKGEKNVEAPSTPEAATLTMLHPSISTLIDLTDEQKVVTIKVEQAEQVIVIDDGPCINEEKKDGTDKNSVKSTREKNRIQHLETKALSSSNVLLEGKRPCTKDEPIVIEDDLPIKVENNQVEKEIKIEDLTGRKQNKSTSSTIQDATRHKTFEDDAIIIEDEPSIKIENPKIKNENSTDHIAITGGRTNEQVVATNNSVARQDQSGAASFGVEGIPQAAYASILTEIQMSKMAKSITKLTKYVSKCKVKKKHKRKKSKRKSKSLRSRSSSSSRSPSSLRSRSTTPHERKSYPKSHLKKTYKPKQYQSRSPSLSPSREKHPSTSKKIYYLNYRSGSSSRSFTNSPHRKRNRNSRLETRSYSRTSSPTKTKALILKKGNSKKSPSLSPYRHKRRPPSLSPRRRKRRSPSVSPPRRKRRYSTSSSSSTDTSSSLHSNKRRRRGNTSKSNSSTSRSCSPKKNLTTGSSKNAVESTISSLPNTNLPSTSQQTVVAQQTYKHEIRQGNNVMTRKATVTTSYKEELQSFKNAVQNKSNSLSDHKVENPSELNKSELTVFDQGGRDVTMKRPDGDLNHPFYIHPEDAELYQMKCRNGLQPLQALHEICVKCGWKFPNYLLLPTPKGFRFGMEINGHRFVTEKTAQQKKLAKAAAALTVLQWMKIAAIT